MRWANFASKTFYHELYGKVFDTGLFDRSAQVAFYFSFAFFPLLLFLLTLFGMVLDQTDKLQAELYSYLARIMPGSAYTLVRTTMDEIIETSSGGKLTLGLFATLWSASAGIDSLRSAMNAVYETDEDRAFWKTKLQSLVLTFGFILLLALALIMITAGSSVAQTVAAAAGLSNVGESVMVIVQWLLLLVVLLFATAVVYSWLPSFEEFRWVWVSPGAVVAIILWVILTAAFKLYLQYFKTYNKAYGSLGAVIILMLWMYLTALALLMGGAINSVLTEMSPSSGARKAQEGEAEHKIQEEKKKQKRKPKDG
jgi:membrane protein